MSHGIAQKPAVHGGSIIQTAVSARDQIERLVKIYSERLLGGDYRKKPRRPTALAVG
jgi:hypothetical protein